MYKNRINRPQKDIPRTQGYKDWETGETHAPMDNNRPRVGVSKWKHKRKCHCKETCGGHKRNTIAENEDWKNNWKKEINE